MPKRTIDMDERYEVYKKRKSRLNLLDTPPINSIEDLIEIGHSLNFYKTIDSIMIWRITPYLEELNDLVGMTSLKESIFNQILYYIQGMHTRNSEGEYLHTLLLGPPGTGKTTVAKILAKIYRGLGILSADGPFKEVHRDDFIAGYLGQTAIKTQKLLKSCKGGVMFCDEFYALGSGRDDNRDYFAKEAVDTLTSYLSEHTQDFCFIGAGYEKEVKKLYKINSGLESRFQWKHIIDKYTSEDLAEIFIRKVDGINWEVNVDKAAIAKIIDGNIEDLFKSAGRDVVNFMSKCKIAHSRRIANSHDFTKFVLTQEDLVNGLERLKNHSLTVGDEADEGPPPSMFM